MPLQPHTGIAVLLAAALCAGASHPADAQDAPLLLEAHGGASIPLGDLRDGDGPGEGTTTGPSLSVTFGLASGGWRTIYVGFSQHRFGCEAAGCGPDGRYVATGFNAGLRIVPIPRGPVVPWLAVGVITTRVETGDLAATPQGAPDAGVSELGFGGQAGVGALVRLSQSLGWSVAGTLSSVGSKLPGGASLPLRYVTAHTGITLLF